MNNFSAKHVLCCCILGGMTSATWAQLTFQNVVSGETLDLTQGKTEGRDTAAVKAFMQTGVNPYNEDKEVLVKGKAIFATACSGCHGHLGEGKIGPAINTGRWDYPQLEEDKGLFETIFGGAARQMGPQYDMLTQDEILQVMAWVRHLYVGNPADASWLTDSQKAAFKPYAEK